LGMWISYHKSEQPFKICEVRKAADRSLLAAS
jgi:hypothetical protein